MKRHLFSITILSVLLVLGAMVAPTNADLAPTSQEVGVSAKTLSGTIEGIDPSQRIVTIQSEEKQGEMMLLAFSDPDVVKGLSKGDRVVVELDDTGWRRRSSRPHLNRKTCRPRKIEPRPAVAIGPR